MIVELVSNWSDPRIVAMINTTTYQKAYLDILCRLAKISRKPKDKIIISTCSGPFLSHLAIDLILAGDVHKHTGYTPCCLMDGRFEIERALPEDVEHLTLANTRFDQFEPVLGRTIKDDLTRTCARPSISCTCWCSGGIKDTWRMAGFHAEYLICYSFGTDGPDEACVEICKKSDAKEGVHVNIEQLLTAEIEIVPKKKARKKKISLDTEQTKV